MFSNKIKVLLSWKLQTIRMRRIPLFEVSYSSGITYWFHLQLLLLLNASVFDQKHAALIQLENVNACA